MNMMYIYSLGVWKLLRYKKNSLMHELSKTLAIKSPTLPKRASVHHLNTSKINDASKQNCPDSSLFKVEPIWVFATEPLVLAMPRRQKVHLGGHRHPKGSFLDDLKCDKICCF